MVSGGVHEHGVRQFMPPWPGVVLATVVGPARHDVVDPPELTTAEDRPHGEHWRAVAVVLHYLHFQLGTLGCSIRSAARIPVRCQRLLAQHRNVALRREHDRLRMEQRGNHHNAAVRVHVGEGRAHVGEALLCTEAQEVA